MEAIAAKTNTFGKIKAEKIQSIYEKYLELAKKVHGERVQQLTKVYFFPSLIPDNVQLGFNFIDKRGVVCLQSGILGYTKIYEFTHTGEQIDGYIFKYE